MPPPKDPIKREQWRLKIVASKVGARRSPETNAKLSVIHKAQWADPEYRAKMVAERKRRWTDPDYHEKVSTAIRERNRTPEVREKMRVSQLKRFEDPEQHRLHSQMAKDLRFGYWNKGKEHNPGIKNSNQYNRWRAAILERDNSTCQSCGSMNDIVVHHIIDWKKSVELRFDVTNGITLCRPCHGKHHYPKGKPVASRRPI